MTCKDCLHFEVCKHIEDGIQFCCTGGNGCDLFKNKADFVELEVITAKPNTCPLSLDNNCVPMACSCGSVNVELCRNLFRAYALGYHEATARKNAELKEIPTETPEILKEKINIYALDACPEIETNPVPLSTANTTFKQT